MNITQKRIQLNTAKKQKRGNEQKVTTQTESKRTKKAKRTEMNRSEKITGK